MPSLTAGGLIKGSTQWTPEQYAWLQAQARRLGLISAAAVARQIVQAAIDAERQQDQEPAA